MGVKQLWKKMMTGAKNLKISADLHRRIKIAAAQEETPIAVYAEALLEIGLQHKQETKRLLQADTNQEPHKGGR